MDKDTKLYDNVSLGDIFKKIDNNHKKKSTQIDQLIAILQPLVKTPSDAAVIVPLIKEYVEAAIKNDDHLVKLAAIAQRLVNSGASSTPGEGFYLTEAEKDELENQITQHSSSKADTEEVREAIEQAREEGKNYEKGLSVLDDDEEIEY